MKKSVVYLSVVLASFANVSFASPVQSVEKSSIVVFDVTPIGNAIIKGDIETVKKFIEYGVNVNEYFNGITPLMLAARSNKVDIVKLLLEKGADAGLKDQRGYNAAKHAEMSKAVNTLAILQKA